MNKKKKIKIIPQSILIKYNKIKLTCIKFPKNKKKIKKKKKSIYILFYLKQ